MNILPSSFYHRSPLAVGPDLIGKILVRIFEGQVLSGRIVEVEAYLGTLDPAAHSYKGQTKRTASLYKKGGTAYVHSIHMQMCLDLVTEEAGMPTSVLIRALEPIEGIEFMKKVRGKDALKDLTSGPGKLTQSLMVTKELDGSDLTQEDSALYVLDDGYKPAEDDIIATVRIGISQAQEEKYRFYLKDSPSLSRK